MARKRKKSRKNKKVRTIGTAPSAGQEVGTKRKLARRKGEKLAHVTEDDVAKALGEGAHKEAELMVRALFEREVVSPFLHTSLAVALWHQGYLDEAWEAIQDVVEAYPGHLDALVCGVHFAVVLGQREKAEEWVGSLSERDVADVGELAKTLEGLSYYDDEERILACFRQERERILEGVVPESEEEQKVQAQCYFYAGVAAARLDDDKEAWLLLERAQELCPNLPELEANLDDLSNPSKSKEGAWAFPLERWVRLPLTEKDIMTLSLASNTHSLRREKSKKIWKRYPHLETIIPLLLRRGSPTGRQGMVGVACALSLPQTLDALEEFAKGRWGTDAVRWGVFCFLLNKRRFKQGDEVVWWEKGQQTTDRIFAFALYDEVRENSRYDKYLPKKAANIFHEGTMILREKRYKDALHLLEQAFAMAPNHPGVVMNLAVAYDSMGDRARCRELVTTMMQQHPDYFIGRTQMSRLASQNEDPEEAWRWLEPCLYQSDLHVSEFTALFEAALDYWILQGNKEEARIWLDVYREYLPDSPQILAWEGTLSRRVRVMRWLMFPFMLLFLALYGLLVLLTEAVRKVIGLVKKV